MDQKSLILPNLFILASNRVGLTLTSELTPIISSKYGLINTVYFGTFMTLLATISIILVYYMEVKNQFESKNFKQENQMNFKCYVNHNLALKVILVLKVMILKNGLTIKNLHIFNL